MLRGPCYLRNFGDYITYAFRMLGTVQLFIFCTVSLPGFLLPMPDLGRVSSRHLTASFACTYSRQKRFYLYAFCVEKVRVTLPVMQQNTALENLKKLIMVKLDNFMHGLCMYFLHLYVFSALIYVFSALT